MIKKHHSVSSNTTHNPEEQAQLLLNAGHYKEAIRLFKKLSQDSDNDKWRQQLAYCYLQRALTFAARGMHQEALVLWDNHTQYTEPPYQSFDHYITWLIQTKNQVRIQSGLTRLSAHQLDKQYPELASVLGFLMLTEHPEFQQDLPQDSSFMAHFELVQTALLAYQNNNQDEINKALKKLPYRSAFRDFRTLLSAVILIPAETAGAQTQLLKIPSNSPYRQAAQLLLASTRNGFALTQSLLPFKRSQQKIVAEIKGLNKKQLGLIEQITQYHDGLSDKLKFNLAIQYQSLCGTDLARRYCMALLASYPKGRREFNKHFTAIDAFEENRLKALTFERNNNSYEAEYYWKLCIKILIDENADNGLKIALILRHIAGQQESEDQVQLLIESLLHDPDDHDTHLKILRYFSHQPDATKEYKNWLNKTCEKFPQDIDVLTLATETAYRNKAYKKASQYALKILKVDSVNVFAKHSLFSSYMAHIRRLIQTKKYHLVENEIQQAEVLNSSKNHTKQTQLMRGFLCFADQDKQRGIQLITEALDRLNSDPINTHFQAAMEAQLTGAPVATILRELPSTINHLLSDQELTRLIKQIQEYAKNVDIQQPLHKALDKIKRELKKSLSQQNITEKMLLTVCQVFDSINHFELLRHCLKLSLGKWENPIWKFYRIYAEVNGLPERCSPINIMYLENLREQAMEDKQHRTVVMIDGFVEQYYRAHPERNMGFIDDLFGYDDEAEVESQEDPLEQLFAHIPEKVLIKLDKKFESLLKKTSPELLVKQLKNVIGDNKNIMSAMMQEPDLFTALLMLRAADELGIDIGVSVGDVLECFSFDKQTDIFSFPF